MDQTLLDGPQNEPQIDPNKDYLTELVGDNKKFKTQQDLAKGKYESDLYIKTLEKKQDELRTDYLKLREDYNARAKLEELIGQLEARSQSPDSTTPKAEVKDKPVIDPKEIESLVSNKIQEYELTRKQQQNFSIVRDRLKERFGDNYQTALKQQIENLGLTEEDVNQLAKKSPNAFFKTIGIDQPQQAPAFQPPFQSSQRTNFAPTGAKKRTWSYYQEMKKTNPKAYYDSKTNVQMHNDYIELGKEFEDGDFSAI